MSSDNTPPDLEAAEAFEHLGWECVFHDRLPEAIGYHRRALAAREQSLGPEHPEVANSLVMLAGVIGRDEPAGPEVETLNRRAAAIYESLVRRSAGERGEAFRHAAQGLLGTLHNLALLAWRRGDVSAAEAGFRDVQAGLPSTSVPTAWGSTHRCRSSPDCSPNRVRGPRRRAT